MQTFRWTREAPEVPGEYWWRSGDRARAERIRVPSESEREGLPKWGEWWRPDAAARVASRAATGHLMSVQPGDVSSSDYVDICTQMYVATLP